MRKYSYKDSRFVLNTVFRTLASNTKHFSLKTVSEEQKTLEFLKKLGYDKKISGAIIHSLLEPDTGITSSTLFQTVESLAGAYEIGKDAGLETLAKTVEMDMSLREGKEEVAFKFKLPNTTYTSAEFLTCSGLEGMSIKDLVEYGRSDCSKLLSEYLECACSGIMACSTCHVYVTEGWFDKLNEILPVTEAENDMIDLAFEPRDNSRLGCQIKFSKALRGLALEIPGSSNNLFDHIPFKDTRYS